ncbi:hypothetical protein QMT05_00610 [Cronobacter malonaticus]|uniref:hypothetical protein n=1 Tax=Cronobacter malonaticus TaxID=413503 RepID=UPI0024C27AEF|nr:hypothetical protein [Cronobacter malonaticus]MDK1176393.1 hypothetical protein [Cronobacter malonaticus]MDK1685500.1 hypothetical protein [Cronobacter malonaticus]
MMSYDNLMKEKDIRKCRFFVRYIERQRWHNTDDFDWRNNADNLEAMRLWVRDAIYYSGKNKSEDIDKYDDIDSRYKEYILPIEEFDWIKNDLRACYYIYLEIKHHKDNSERIITNSTENKGVINIIRSKEYYLNEIICYFDVRHLSVFDKKFRNRHFSQKVY